jgi:hypothetical protein
MRPDNGLRITDSLMSDIKHREGIEERLINTGLGVPLQRVRIRGLGLGGPVRVRFGVTAAGGRLSGHVY